jgi:hypothetical protein
LQRNKTNLNREGLVQERLSKGRLKRGGLSNTDGVMPHTRPFKTAMNESYQWNQHCDSQTYKPSNHNDARRR